MTLFRDAAGWLYAAVYVDSDGFTRDSYIKTAYSEHNAGYPKDKWLVDKGNYVVAMSSDELGKYYEALD